jgi:2-polyprenyl-3-methyl-5-hydroxy-6-metoxy-1,4-benzoquinol methylase
MSNYIEEYLKPNSVPWTRKEPPKYLVKLIEKGVVKPCKAIDVGCGEGFNSKYLKSKCFEVTGIDFSKNAIKFAKKNAPGINFKVKDMVDGDLTKLGKFDFCLEWSIMHCINPKERVKYVKNISSILNSGAFYVSSCFNIKADKFGKPGDKVRDAPTGKKLWFVSMEELTNLFEKDFKIIKSDENASLGGSKANYLLMKKK